MMRVGSVSGFCLRTGCAALAVLGSGRVNHRDVASLSFDEWIRALGLAGDRRVVLAGTSGPTEKCVVVCIAEDDAPSAFVKVGTEPSARHRIAREADLLARAGDGLAPQLLGSWNHGPWTGLAMLPVPGKAIPADASVPRDLSSLLALSGPGMRVPVRSHPLTLVLAASYDERLALFTRFNGNHPVAVCLTHGDFAPWNVLRHQGRYGLVDWEYCSELGMPYLDDAHWVVRVSTSIQGLTPTRALHRAVEHLVCCYAELDNASATAFVGILALLKLQHCRQDLRGATDPECIIWTAIAERAESALRLTVA